MKKALAVIFLFFFSLVGIDWFVSVIAGTSGLPPFPPIALGQSSGCVSSINVNLFAKNGVGQSCVTQGYGRTPYSYLYPDDWHDGIDIAARYGASIYSPNNGIVVATGDQDDYCYHRGFGKYVAVRDPANDLILWYAHLGTINVSARPVNLPKH